MCEYLVKAMIQLITNLILRKPHHTPSPCRDVSISAAVFVCSAVVPVVSVYLNRDPVTKDSKVNKVSTNSMLGFKANIKSGQRLPHSPFDISFMSLGAKNAIGMLFRKLMIILNHPSTMRGVSPSLVFLREKLSPAGNRRIGFFSLTAKVVTAFVESYGVKGRRRTGTLRSAQFFKVFFGEWFSKSRVIYPTSAFRVINVGLTHTIRDTGESRIGCLRFAFGPRRSVSSAPRSGTHHRAVLRNVKTAAGNIEEFTAYLARNFTPSAFTHWPNYTAIHGGIGVN